MSNDDSNLPDDPISGAAPISHRERYNPFRNELAELLEMLGEANDAGELVAIQFMLRKPTGGATIVDFRGSHEYNEITSRLVRSRIAIDLEPKLPAIAAAIKADLAREAH